MLKNDFGKRLLTLRKDKDVSQAEVAEFIGLTVAAYQNYENGRREAGYDTISKLADFYNVSTDYLLGRENEEPPPTAIDIFAKQANLEELEKILIEKYLELSENQREAVLDFMREAIQEEEHRKKKETYYEYFAGEIEDILNSEKNSKEGVG